MSSSIALKELFKAGFDDFVIPSYEDAPFTTIQNRAKVTRSLKAIAGVERVHVKGLNLLQNEFGPNGEQVWEASNKDARLRMVGSGWTSIANAGDTSVQTSTIGDYLEITFYGTGINWLCATYSTAADLRTSVDGGVEGSNIWVGTTYSSILSARNYSQNNAISLASGLTLGWHTIKLRYAVAVAVRFSGFEILNQRTDLAVYPGAGVSQGSFTGLSALSTSAFNAGVSGTKGARVVKYIENGTLSQAVQEVDTTAKYMTSTDHTNEEILRRINFREFGVNRADDFSTLAGVSSARAFTLDDGTTTLIGSSTSASTFYGSIETIGFGASSFISITFVGTGLDFFGGIGNSAGSIPVSVDGVSIGNLNLPAAAQIGVVKLVSGLPYGTHTVKFGNYSSGGIGITDFIIYQPKKPSVPAGAFEVADYNVMANYVATTAGLETNSSGVLKKPCVRESVFVGAGWALASLAPANDWNGFGAITTTLDNYVEYTFWGTGFDLRFYSSTTASGNVEVRLNGSLLTTANFPTLVSSVAAPAGVSFTNTTGILDQSVTTGSQAGCLFSVSGLPLGRYTVRLTNKASGSTMLFNSFDIITPIHINNPSLKIGSQSLKSAAKYSPEKVQSNAGPDLSKAKAWVIYNGVDQTILGSFNISAVLRAATGQYIIYFDKLFKNTPASSALSSSQEITINSVSNRSITITTQSSAGASQNVGVVCVVFFGELIGEQ